eukprot:TRINITY_DN13_c0_g1_i7.p1 TRINITY_DN13_c0_g1~~TRINITY_DN13_c0_g1_i7.p1  ORF type:complete len:939 (-),score=288.58 TRINITY_DN13_c0_g1_i7:108-2924(-)
MRVATLFVCAAVAVSLAIDTESQAIDGSTELLQESAKIGVHAKQGLETEDLIAQGAGATMKIWGKEVSTATIQQAQKQLHRVMTKISVKRPEIIGSISTIQELTDNPGELGEGKLDGGFKKLRKVLIKIDDLQQELIDEEIQLNAQIAAAKAKCDDQWHTSESNLNNMITEYEQSKAATIQHKNGITADKEKIGSSEETEKEVWNDRLSTSEEDTKAAYDKYWLESDDRAEVRGILMQAVWLVCYGFRTFRHDDFCETLRKQPDFAEDGTAQDSTAAPGAALNAKTSYSFSETMEQVWKLQKAADAHAVNSGDGDPDMEKGFINNKAPWGVDPDDSSEMSLVQEAVGVDSHDLLEDGTMGSKAIASRLEFLLQSSSMASNYATPLQELVEAFQEDGEEEERAASRRLQGVSDDEVDQTKSADCDGGEADCDGGGKADAGKADGDDDKSSKPALGESKKTEEKKLGEPTEGWWQREQSYTADTRKKKTLVMIMVGLEKECGTVQHEADLEWLQHVSEATGSQMSTAQGLQQETQIQNSLQNSIKNHNIAINEISKVDVGQKKAIDDLTTSMHQEMEICETEWMELDVAREANEEEQTNIRRLNSLLRVLALGDSLDCDSPETNDACSASKDQGQCTFWNRGSEEGGSGPHDADRTFCACEWGFYGEQCDRKKCPGLGHVLYKSTDPGVCSNRGGQCDDTVCTENGCNDETGMCTSCHHKYHGFGAAVNKCQFKYCPMAASTSEQSMDTSDYRLPTNEGELAAQCSNHGECNQRSGICSCDADYWGAHCGYKKCPGAASEGSNAVAAKFPGWSASACHNRGECKTVVDSQGQLEGKCMCDEAQSSGESCEYHVCPGDCQDHGECKKETGMCMCDAPYHGSTCQGGEGGKRECFACTYTTCPDDCGGAGGWNKISGHCGGRGGPGAYNKGGKSMPACPKGS